MNQKSLYDLYEAEVTYDEEEGSWGKHVIAVPTKFVNEQAKTSAKREHGSKIADSISKKINPDNVNEVIGGIVKAMSGDMKLARLAKKAFQSAADTVINGSSAHQDFWNELK